MSLGGALRVMLSELASVGVDPAVACAEPRVAVPEDDAVPFGLDELTRVLERAEALSGDPLLGLHMAERAHGRGVLSYLARAQRTVGDGLRAFARFAGSAWGTAAVQLERRGTREFVGFRLGPAIPRHVLEYVVARTAISLRRSGAAAREAWFGHAPGGASREYERVLRCPPPSARLAAAVEDAFARGVPVDRETLARSLGMSGRTLARRLAGEQRTFRDVVDGARRALAQRLVVDGTLDLGAVATRVGFSDLAAFGKAFRRWFGEAPSVYRTALWQARDGIERAQVPATRGE